MTRALSLSRWIATLLLAALALAPPAGATDHIVAGTLGGQAPLWPFYIAIHKGMLAAENLDMEVNFAPSGAGVVQQLTGGSIDVALSVGFTDPVQAIDKGAPLAVVRVIGKSAPYALAAKPAIKTLADLKGKIISTGASTDITSVYFERMMAAVGLKKGDYDTISAGVAAARFAALQAGVADAAMLLPPLSFHAAKAGYPTIGLPYDYVKDIPFTAMAVRRPWAEANKDILRRLLVATDKSMAWFADPSHRAEAIELLVAVGHSTPEDADASYDFLRRIDYFEAGSKVSRGQLKALMAIEKERGLVAKDLNTDRLVIDGLTELTD